MSDWQVHTPYLLIPVEIRVREFDAKLLLSCVAAEAGFSVIVGQAEQIKKNAPYLPRGVIVERSVSLWKLKDFRRFRRLGNHIVAWCEEGLATLDADYYVKHRIAEDVLGATDRFFAWGPNQANMITTRIPDSNHKMVVTGNIRFDLLREPYRDLFASRVGELKARYGPFILINTNFGHYNNILGREAAVNRLTKQRQIKDREEQDFFWQWSDYAGKKYHHFIDMVAFLSDAFPQHTIVVRPHPSEDFAQWQQHTASLSNVQVVHDGTVVPWLMAAEVVIHNSCTTGVEAYVAGTPVVAYRPVQSEKFDAGLPNDISKQVASLAELQATLKDILAQPLAFAHDQQTDPNTRRVLRHYIANLEGTLASEQIVSTLQQYARQNLSTTNVRLNSMHNRVRRSVGFINAKCIDALRRTIVGRTYGEYKFPNVSVGEVADMIDGLRNVSGRFGQIKVRSAGLQNLFHIHQA